MSKKELISPFNSTIGEPVSLLTYDRAFELTEKVIDNLSDEALDEFMSGYENDVDFLIQNIMNEAVRVLTVPKKINKEKLHYLSYLSKSIEETFRVNNIHYFVLDCWKDFQWGWHNIEWFNLFHLYPRLCIMASRGHGKTFGITQAVCLWNLYRYNIKSNSKDIQMSKEGIIITNEASLAIKLLGDIKGVIESNDILSEKLYNDKKGVVWREEEIVTYNKAELKVKSATSKSIRGRHPTYGILDDFLNERVIFSADQNEKYKEIFRSNILPAVENAGRITIAGTPYTEEDLYGDLIRERSDALEKLKTGEFTKSMLDKTFACFKYPCIFPDGTLLNSLRFSYDDLMTFKHTQGSLRFDREFMINPRADSNSIFTRDILDQCKDPEIDLLYSMTGSKHKFTDIIIGCDFAVSKNQNADYSVFTVIGKRTDGKYQFLNCIRGRGIKYDKQIAAIRKMYLDFYADKIIVEVNGQQAPFADMLNDTTPSLPVDRHITGENKYSIYIGLPALTILFEKKKIIFPYKSEKAKKTIDTLFSELVSIAWIPEKKKLQSTNGHDDMVMSLWMCFQGFLSEKKLDFAFL